MVKNLYIQNQKSKQFINREDDIETTSRKDSINSVKKNLMPNRYPSGP